MFFYLFVTIKKNVLYISSLYIDNNNLAVKTSDGKRCSSIVAVLQGCTYTCTYKYSQVSDSLFHRIANKQILIPGGAFAYR